MKLLLLFFVCCISSASFSQLSWETVEVPMSDGYGLAADIYIPTNWETGPVILVQTPYNKDFYHLIGLPVGTGFNQDESNYVYVIMDWRGFYGSAEDAYVGSPTRGEDGYDCVQWIASQPWCDGHVGTWGPSALGRIQYQTARENPPNLTCMVPLVAGPQYNYQEYYPGGVYRTEYVEQLDNLGFGISPLLLANPYYNLLWTFSENDTMYPEDIHVPTFMIGGWYDHNVEVMMDFFSELQVNSPSEVQDQHRLLFGPWVHGGIGFSQVGSALQGELEYPGAQGWNDSLAMAFFDFHMRGINNGWDLTPAVRYFQMGDDEWLEAGSWPVPGTTPVALYLHNDLGLSTSPPNSFDGVLSFQYNPEDPSPTVGGPTLSSDLEQGPYDQAPLVESRNDLLSFTTPILAGDAVVKGTVEVHLKVGSSTPDTDFSGRLCDVYPDGRSMLVADGIFRMRFKNGFTATDESFMQESEVYACDFNFPNTAITFKEGHRIRLDITSSNYPRFNRNMNTGEAMYPGPSGDTLVNPLVATNSVYALADVQSYIVLPLAGTFPTGIAETASRNDFHLFPNPAREMVHIQPKQPASDMVVRIMDGTGRCVGDFTLYFPNFDLDISRFSPGLYWLEIRSETTASRVPLLID